MSTWSRLLNVFRQERVNREIDEELQAHLDEAVAHGRDPEEARRALGSALRLREASRDVRLLPWLDSLRADTVFGWRQLRKAPVSSLAAILSLGLAIGACVAAFRLVDALLLRPLPVVDPGRLFVVTYPFDEAGVTRVGDSFDYPQFRALRAALRQDADLMAISSPNRHGVTFGGEDDIERCAIQRVSGWMFPEFGLRPSLGRLLTASDDVKPGGHPVAVISYDYWQRRFAGDPGVIGRRFRLGRDPFEIVGVAPRGFTGTEPGTMTDIFLPTMSNAAAIDSSYWSWFRIWVRVRPGSSRDRCAAGLRAAIARVRTERVKTWPADRQQHVAAGYLRVNVTLDPASAGVSEMRRDYRTALTTLSIVAGLVLLIACLNVANLMSGQGAARAREMAMRVSIGAGRGRLAQLVLVESVLMTACASALGALLAAWAAPFVVGRLSSAADDLPIRLALPADWRVVGFATLLGLLVTGLFGIIPALRAARVPAMSVLRGGAASGSRRLPHALIAAQVAFCFVVQLAAGLFISTFHRLSTQPTGFAADGLVALETVTRQNVPLDVEYWEQVRHHLEQVDGVESVARCWSAPMTGNSWISAFTVNGGRYDPRDVFLMGVTPGWLKTMRVPLLDGRDLADADDFEHAALVNEAFARRYSNGRSPVGLHVFAGDDREGVPRTVVGYVADARYNDLRGPVYPTVYAPIRGHGQGKDWSFFMVRARADVQLSALAQRLPGEVRRARPEFRAVSVHMMRDLVDQHLLRERLLAMLSAFFAVVAVLIACVGIYGTLHQWVVQRRREIGIRLALGAPAGHLVVGATRAVFAMLLLGSAAGVALGLGAQRYIGDLLYGVRATDWQMLALPVVTILGAAALAALPPVMRALRVDPVTTLRAE